MKGYAKVTVSKEEAKKIGDLIEPAIEYYDNFIIETKVSGFWLFKSYLDIYRSDPPPHGVYTKEYKSLCATYAFKKYWVDDLYSILNLRAVGDEIHLGEELAQTLNSFRLGRYNPK